MRILHVHTSLGDNPSTERSMAIAAALSEGNTHSFASAQPVGDAALLQAIHVLADFPAMSGLPTLGRLQRLVKAMIGYDVVFTYEYGAIDAVMACTAFSSAFALPPVIHHECYPEQVSRRSAWYRRIALDKSAALVVAHEPGRQRALTDWQQPSGRIAVIPDGIDVSEWRKVPRADILPSLLKRPGEMWIGSSCSILDQNSLVNLLKAVAQLTENWQLVLICEEDGRGLVRREAERLKIVHRVHLPGKPGKSSRATGLFDIAVFLPNKRSDPFDVIRAMACATPIVADPASAAMATVSAPNLEFMVSFDRPEELSIALATLAADQNLRRTVGLANADLAQENHALEGMTRAYKRLLARIQ